MIGKYEQISNSFHDQKSKSIPFLFIKNGRVSVGTKSKHKTKSGCKFRLFWRIKKVGR